jgi:CheY-like chemotaxis protein
VEDNANNQQVAQELLEGEGALVTIAIDGEQGVAAVAAADPPFDVVLMDVQMPVMDGYTATTEIRHRLGLVALPIIAMTANAMSSDRDASLAAGMNDHVGKPFDLDELVATLLRHAGRVPVPPTPGVERSVAPALPAELLAEARQRGIDLESAVSRLGGRADVWTRTAQSFAGQLAGMADSLSGMLERSELVEAGHMMHTLKGLAAMLGAADLTELVSSAEQHLRGSCTPDFLAGLRQRALEQIDRTRLDFEALLHLQRSLTPATGVEPTARDAQALVMELGALAGLLGEADMAATDSFAALQDAHEAHWAEELAPLSEAVSALDFERALMECKKLTRKLATV